MKSSRAPKLSDPGLKQTQTLLRKLEFSDFEYHRPEGRCVTREIVSFSCKRNGCKVAVFYQDGRLVITPDGTDNALKNAL